MRAACVPEERKRVGQVPHLGGLATPGKSQRQETLRARGVGGRSPDPALPGNPGKMKSKEGWV